MFRWPKPKKRRMTPQTPSDPVAELSAFANALEASHKIVREGGMVDFGGLEMQVEHFCSEVVKTEGPLRLQLLPLLEKVIRVLGTLEDELRISSRNAARSEEAGKRLLAQSAYGSTGKR
jgi:hypothetical protein